LDLGYSFKKFVRDTAVNYAGMEVAKATVLNAFFAAVALPLTVMKLGYVIDNPWLIAADKSKKAGTGNLFIIYIFKLYIDSLVTSIISFG
jgi:hypothetical protein